MIVQQNTSTAKDFMKFHAFADEVGAFFRRKDQYSLFEKLVFLVDFFKSHAVLQRICEENEILKEGGSIAVGYTKNDKRLLLSTATLQNTYDAVVSVAYFNLSSQEIEELKQYAKSQGMLSESHIITKIFEKFVSCELEPKQKS